MFLIESLTLYPAKEAASLCGAAPHPGKCSSALGWNCFPFFGVDALYFVFAGVGLLLRGSDNVRQGQPR